MTADQPDAVGVDPAARALIVAVRTFVGEAMRDQLRLQMQGSERATADYALACMEEMPVTRIPALVAAHDALAHALNAASPESPPIMSMTTERPA